MWYTNTLSQCSSVSISIVSPLFFFPAVCSLVRVSHSIQTLGLQSSLEVHLQNCEATSR